MTKFALIYLDTLDVVEFDDKTQYHTARQAAIHILRPHLTLGRKMRHGRMVWCTRDLHYFDPLVATIARPAFSKS